MTTALHFLILTVCLCFVTVTPSPNGIRAAAVPLIINNSGSNNNNNAVSNGNDSLDGNLINGNSNGDNTDSGNVQKKQPGLLIINNSGNNNSKNEIANGDDDVNGNLINGNGNGNNSGSGNVQNRKPRSSAIAPLIINNSGSNNNNNSLDNGNDNVDGNLVNGNENGDNSNSGNVVHENNDSQSDTNLTTESSSLESDNNKLLKRIDALLDSILRQLGGIKIINKVPKLIQVLLAQVRNILENIVRNVSNTLIDIRNKNDSAEVSNLIEKVDTVQRLCRDKIIELPHLVISLNDALTKRITIELEFIPALLQQILDLLERSS